MGPVEVSDTIRILFTLLNMKQVQFIKSHKL